MKKKHSSTVLLLVILLAGLSLLLYPTVSNYWNSFHQSHAINDYAQQVSQMDHSEYEKIWNDAIAYNAALIGKSDAFVSMETLKRQYNSMLNVGDTGIMGYIEIPTIGVSLPIYHGTSDEVLQIAVGHLDWSALPVGGEGTHCVLSGHRGLPSAKLFTNLDKLVEKDLFIIRVLDETLTYEVDQIRIVLPSETSDLMPVADKDYCTLVTCTPYGINTHRLLVRGHRVENQEISKTVRITADALQVEPMIVACVLAIPVLLILLIGVLIYDSRHRGRKKEDN